MHKLIIPAGEEKYPEKPPSCTPAAARTFPSFKSPRTDFFFFFFFSPLFGENIKTCSFAWILSFSSSCFSVFHPDVAHSHLFGLNLISNHLPELPFSCKDGDKIQKCQTEMFSPLILVLFSSLSTDTRILFLPFLAAVLCKCGCNRSERKSLQPSNHSPVHPH